MLPRHQQDAGDRYYLLIDHNSGYSDLSDYLNALNSLDFPSIYGKLHCFTTEQTFS